MNPSQVFSPDKDNEIFKYGKQEKSSYHYINTYSSSLYWNERGNFLSRSMIPQIKMILSLERWKLSLLCTEKLS